MPIELLIPIALFAALMVGFVIVLRRVGVVVAESRESAMFRRSVEDLAGRVDGALADIIGRIDALRRQQIEADEIVAPLEKALDALLGFGEEARTLGGPPVVAASRQAFVAEIDRADRALQMVEHGAAILASINAGPRYAEAQTAIKRGYLNVLHARDAIARHATDIATARSAEEIAWLSRRPRTRST